MYRGWPQTHYVVRCLILKHAGPHLVYCVLGSEPRDACVIDRPCTPYLDSLLQMKCSVTRDRQQPFFNSGRSAFAQLNEILDL